MKSLLGLMVLFIVKTKSSKWLWMGIQQYILPVMLSCHIFCTSQLELGNIIASTFWTPKNLSDIEKDFVIPVIHENRFDDLDRLELPSIKAIDLLNHYTIKYEDLRSD